MLKVRKLRTANNRQRMPEHTRAPHVSFDNIDYTNSEQLYQAQDSMIREQWVRVSALKTVRRALEKCYKISGVNHYEECKPLAEKYMQMLPDHRVSGYMGYQKNDPSK